MSEPPTPSAPDSPQSPAGHPVHPASPPDPATSHSSAPQFLPAQHPAAPPAGYPAQAPAAPQPPTQEYPPAPGAYPQPTPDGQPTEAIPPAPVRPEQVGRGILFSLLAIVLGALLAGLLYQWGYIASITSFVMAIAAGWLYTKGAGAPPRKGVAALIGVIVVGVIISLLTMLGWGLYSELAAEYPDAAFGEIMPVVLDNLFYPPVWSVFIKDAGIFVVFAALGTFTTLRQLRRGAAQA